VKTGKWLPQQDILGNMTFCVWQDRVCINEQISVMPTHKKSSEDKINCYFYNLGPSLWLHAIKSSWEMSSVGVQFMSSVPQTVSVVITRVYVMRDVIACCIYTHTVFSELGVLFHGTPGG
jgi:hypothetical protein